MVLQAFAHANKREETRQAEFAAKKADYLKEAAQIELVR